MSKSFESKRLKRKMKELSMLLRSTISNNPVRVVCVLLMDFIKSYFCRQHRTVFATTFVDSKSYWCSTAPWVATPLGYTVRCAVWMMIRFFPLYLRTTVRNTMKQTSQLPISVLTTLLCFNLMPVVVIIFPIHIPSINLPLLVHATTTHTDAT